MKTNKQTSSSSCNPTKTVKKTRRESINQIKVEPVRHNDTTLLIDVAENYHNPLDNDLIREMILEYVIDGVSVSRKDICSVRLVGRKWRKDVFKILRKSRKPLYYLVLSEENSLDGRAYVRENGMTCLDKFTNTVADTSSIFAEVSSIAPLCLKIDYSFFREENQQSFTEFLTSGITLRVVELEIEVPQDGGSMNLIFPTTLSFPILQMAIVNFCSTCPMSGSHGSNSYFLPFLQPILAGAKELKDFGIHAYHDYTPVGVRYMKLPISITSIVFHDYFVNSSKMEILVRNPLPQLTYLSLQLPHLPNSDDLLFRVLDNVKTTLRKLYLVSNEAHLEPLGNPNYFRFPVMEQLDLCKVDTGLAVLEPQQSLESVFPKLEQLGLLNHTADMLHRWTDHSRIATVCYLQIGLVDSETQENSVPVHLEEMKAIHKTFSGLYTLDLTLSGRDYGGFHYLFTNMKWLKVLKLRVKGSEHNDVINPHYWNSLFIGVPIDVAAVLSNPSNWKYFELKDDKKFPSIRNLSALHRLDLKCEFPQGGEMDQRGQSLISDAAFHFAFLKMPCLTELNLKGKFFASPEMTAAWKIENRTINYVL